MSAFGTCVGVFFSLLRLIPAEVKLIVHQSSVRSTFLNPRPS